MTVARVTVASPMLKAAELLLQERVPRTAANVFSAEDLELADLSTGRADGAEHGRFRLLRLEGALSH